MLHMFRRFTTTATWGQTFKPTETADEFTFKVYTGGHSTASTADTRMAKEADAFSKAQGYKSYRVVKRKFSFFPSGYKYTVQFAR